MTTTAAPIVAIVVRCRDCGVTASANESAQKCNSYQCAIARAADSSHRWSGWDIARVVRES